MYILDVMRCLPNYDVSMHNIIIISVQGAREREREGGRERGRLKERGRERKRERDSEREREGGRETQNERGGGTVRQTWSSKDCK